MSKQKLTVPEMLALGSEPTEGMSENFQAAIAKLVGNYQLDLAEMRLKEALGVNSDPFNDAERGY
jgi:hypothetical protein